MSTAEILPSRTAPMDHNYLLNPFGVFTRYVIAGDGHVRTSNAHKIPESTINKLFAAFDTAPEQCVALIVSVSVDGRSIKEEYPITALALASCHPKTKHFALNPDTFNKVIRTGSHLLMFASIATQYRGWGRAMVRAVRSWYETKSVDDVTFQVLKYANRHNWTHLDIIRCAHLPLSELVDFLSKGKVAPDNKYLGLYTKMHDQDTTVQEKLGLIQEHRLPHEFIPTELKNHPLVLSHLANTAPYKALLRNLRAFCNHGVSIPQGRLVDEAQIHRHRIHPFDILKAQYNHTTRHPSTSPFWEELKEAFHLSFKNVQALRSDAAIVLDVSGSMWSAEALPGLSSLQACWAFMCVYYKAFEANCPGHDPTMLGFDSYRHDLLPMFRRTKGDYTKIPAELKQGGRTNLSVVLKDMIDKQTFTDMIVFLTDNEINDGENARRLIQTYRKKINPDVRIVNVATSVESDYTLCDPDDPLGMDLHGFDAGIWTSIQAFESIPDYMKPFL